MLQLVTFGEYEDLSHLSVQDALEWIGAPNASQVTNEEVDGEIIESLETSSLCSYFKHITSGNCDPYI